jgi:hypothetical protein
LPYIESTDAEKTETRQSTRSHGDQTKPRTIAMKKPPELFFLAALFAIVLAIAADSCQRVRAQSVSEP